MAKILLAEDDESMLNFLMLALERAGHTVICTRNGLDALKTCEAEGDFDLLLTDIVMPGLDGIELAQKLSDKFKDMRIMFLTGFAAMAMTKGSEAISGQTPKILSKPFHLNDLVDEVEKILGVEAAQ